MAWTVTSGAADTLLREAERAGERECCGLLFGGEGRIDGAVPAANVASDPTRAFETDPAALIAAYRAERAGGPALVGYYHSHPTGSAVPSACDQASAAGDGKVWAIVADGTIRLWRDAPGGFVELSYVVAGG